MARTICMKKNFPVRRDPPFSTRVETPAEATERTRTRTAHVNAQRERERSPFAPQPDLVKLKMDLFNHLTKIGRSDVCADVYDCNPWRYEPILLDDLIHQRLSNGDPEDMAKLRKLIYAGSWSTLSRPTLPDVYNDLAEVQMQERDLWHQKIVHADSDTAKEHDQNSTERLHALEEVEAALRTNILGPELEKATRVIEDLHASLWLELKGMMAAHRISIGELEKHHLTKQVYAEIERIRPIRDLLYARQLYPKHTERTLIAQDRPTP